MMGDDLQQKQPIFSEDHIFIPESLVRGGFIMVCDMAMPETSRALINLSVCVYLKCSKTLTGNTLIKCTMQEY